MTLELGVNIGLSTSDAERDCAAAAALGFKWVRTSQEMQWGGQGLPGLRAYATAAMNHGLKLVQCCQGMPASLARGGRAGHYGPKDQHSADLWGEWWAECSSIVAPTGGVTSCLNEPDGFGWDTTPSSHDCALLHAAALDARDRLAPGTIFVTGEMCPSSSPEPLKFLQDIVAQAPIVLSDDHVWIGWHPYTDPRYNADFDALWNTCHRMRDVHTWLVDQGKPNKRIMAGEWAIANGPKGNVRALSASGVASYVANSYLPTFDAQNDDGVNIAVACWYRLRDAMTPSSWADYCGVLNKNGKPKPVAAVLQAYNAG